MKNVSYLFFVFLLIFISFIGCASQRPVLYPNDKLKNVGDAIAKQDIEECLRLSIDSGVQTETGKKVAGKTVVGAASGAAVGAATGAVTGHAGRGAATGAAGGTAGGFMWGLFHAKELDPMQRRFVEECLRQKGYKIIGWE